MAVSLHPGIPACLVFVLLMDPLSKRLCDSAVFTVFPARDFKQYAVHKLLWPFTRPVFVMAYCPLHHAVRSSVFNPAPGYRRELKEQKKQRHREVALLFFSTGLCLTSYRFQSALAHQQDADKRTSTHFRMASGSTGERIHRPWCARHQVRQA